MEQLKKSYEGPGISYYEIKVEAGLAQSLSVDPGTDPTAESMNVVNWTE